MVSVSLCGWAAPAAPLPRPQILQTCANKQLKERSTILSLPPSLRLSPSLHPRPPTPSLLGCKELRARRFVYTSQHDCGHTVHTGPARNRGPWVANIPSHLAGIQSTGLRIVHSIRIEGNIILRSKSGPPSDWEVPESPWYEHPPEAGGGKSADLWIYCCAFLHQHQSFPMQVRAAHRPIHSPRASKASSLLPAKDIPG
jgi:hypothetical protein